MPFRTNPYKGMLVEGIGTSKTGARSLLWDLTNPRSIDVVGPLNTTDNHANQGFCQVDVDTSTAATVVTADGGFTREATTGTADKYIERRMKVAQIQLYKKLHLRLQCLFRLSNIDKSTFSFGLLVHGHAAAWSKHSGASPNCMTNGIMVRKLGGTGTSTRTFDVVAVEGGANSSAYELLTPNVTKELVVDTWTIATLELIMDKTVASKGTGVLYIGGQPIGRAAFTDLPDTVNLTLAYGCWPMHATAVNHDLKYIYADWQDYVNA